MLFPDQRRAAVTESPRIVGDPGSPLAVERGWGRSSGGANCGSTPRCNATFRTYPHPALRATFSRREKDHGRDSSLIRLANGRPGQVRSYRLLPRSRGAAPGHRPAPRRKVSTRAKLASVRRSTIVQLSGAYRALVVESRIRLCEDRTCRFAGPQVVLRTSIRQIVNRSVKLAGRPTKVRQTPG